MDCSLPGSSVHGILHTRTLPWVAMPFSTGTSRPRDRTWCPGSQADSLPFEPGGSRGREAPGRANPRSLTLVADPHTTPASQDSSLCCTRGSEKRGSRHSRWHSRDWNPCPPLQSQSRPTVKGASPLQKKRNVFIARS